MIAARNAGELNTANLASDAGMPVRTLAPYLALLETLFLIQRMSAWSTNPLQASRLPTQGHAP